MTFGDSSERKEELDMDNEEIKLRLKANKQYKDSVFVDIFYNCEFATENLKN